MHLSSRRNEYRVVDDWHEAQYQSQSAKHHGNNTTDRKGLTRLMPSGLSRSNRTGLRNGLLIGSRGTDERTASCARNTGIVGGFGFPIGEQPDVVLMDMKMPVMDGLEATRQIREAGSSVPIIAVTAYAYDSDRAKALDVGCDDYIAKPLTGDVLKKKLRKHLKR